MNLTDEMKAMHAELEALLAAYLELAGWQGVLAMLARLAEKRCEGRVAGVLQAAQRFLGE